MDYLDPWTNLKFGRAGLDEFLGLARPAIPNLARCEALYDMARTVTLHLIRSDRGIEELELWRNAFSTIAGLARGSYTSRQDAHATDEENKLYLLLLADRFEALHDLLGDQFCWKTNYHLPRVLGLPFVRQSILSLSGKGSVKMEDYMAELGLKNTSSITLLAALRLLTWAEEPSGVYVWLTPAGNALATGLIAEG